MAISLADHRSRLYGTWVEMLLYYSLHLCRLIVIRWKIYWVFKKVSLISEFKRVAQHRRDTSQSAYLNPHRLHPTRISSPPRDEFGSCRVFRWRVPNFRINFVEMWLILAVILALPVLVFAYFELSAARRKRLLNKLKGPPTVPIFGNAHNVGKNPAGNQDNTHTIGLLPFLELHYSWWGLRQYISWNAIRVKAFQDWQHIIQRKIFKTEIYVHIW